jgi:AraC-like DNA-binding protein
VLHHEAAFRRPRQRQHEGGSVKVLDTSALAPGDRAEAFQDIVSQNCTVSVATFENAGTLQAEMHLYDLGPAKVFNIEASGTTLRRTPRAARGMNDCPIAFALPLRTTNRLVRGGRDDRAFGARDLILVDLSSPYTYMWEGRGASYAFHVDYDVLGLPMDTIRKAISELRSSPIYPLVRDHMLRVTTRAGDIEGSGTAADVGTASVDLMRALIVSAAGDSASTRDTMNTTLRTRVGEYIRTHLRDPELSPARIAHANGISVRMLYSLYAAEPLSLEQSIIRQRLQGAHTDLAAPHLRHRTIAAVAQSWGFTSPSFFTSRFRQAFEMTPREWRAGAVALVHAPDRNGARTRQTAAFAMPTFQA